MELQGGVVAYSGGANARTTYIHTNKFPWTVHGTQTSKEKKNETNHSFSEDVYTPVSRTDAHSSRYPSLYNINAPGDEENEVELSAFTLTTL